MTVLPMDALCDRDETPMHHISEDVMILHTRVDERVELQRTS